MDALLSFDVDLIIQIAKLTCQTNSFFLGITRLNIMMDERAYIVPALVKLMPALIELGIHINTQKNLSRSAYMDDYIPILQQTVEVSRAPILKLTFLSETKKDVSKILTSN